MFKAEWTNKDSLDLQPTCNQLATAEQAVDMAIDALREISILAKPSNTVEVVRCKDCKNTITRPDGEIYCKKLDMEEIPVSHFCGWGERKGGDDDDY